MSSALLALVLLAGSSDSTPRCSRSDTISIVECLKSELAREDARLRTIEQRARVDLSHRAAASFDSVRARWVAYRLSECRAYEDSFEGATISGPSGAQCMVDLTRTRQRLLTRLYLNPQH